MRNRILGDLEYTFYGNGEPEKKPNETGYSQWASLDNGCYLPVNKTIDKIPAGLYEIKNEPHKGLHIQKINILSEELFVLPSPEIEAIIADIKKFWEGKVTFKKYKYIHKRGILLHGDPGCGKSGIIQLCIKYIIEQMDGVVINIKDQHHVEMFDDFLPSFRRIEPSRPLIVVMEDIDALTGEDRYVTSKLLNILDGIKQIEGVVYLASTNYPDRLEERISDRPSRFDKRYRIEPPCEKVREAYLKSKLSKDDLEKIDLKKWIKDSDSFSIAHLKELVISTFVLGNSYDESLSHLKQMKIKPRNKGKSSGIGFGSSH
jgi:hypothetical protein